MCQQGSTLTLTCPVGQHLQILLAIYGRLSNAICPPSGVNASTNCASSNATSVISNRYKQITNELLLRIRIMIYFIN